MQITPRCFISHGGFIEAQGSREDPGPRITSAIRWKIFHWHRISRVRAWRPGLRTSKQQKRVQCWNTAECAGWSCMNSQIYWRCLCKRSVNIWAAQESPLLSQKVKMTGHFGKYKCVFITSWAHPLLFLQLLLQLVTILPKLMEYTYTQSSH